MFKKLFSFFWDRSLLIFAIIGGLNTIVSMAGTFLLENFAGWPFLAASVTMYALCSVPSFYFNRKYSFKSTAPLGPSIVRFSIIIVACFTLSYLGTTVLLPWLRATFVPGISDIGYSILRIFGLQAIFTILNYIAQRLWAFKD